MAILLWCVLGIFCIAYGVLVWSVGSGTMFFAVWLALGLACLLVALALKKKWWGRLPIALRKSAVGLFLLGLVFFCVIQGMILSCFGVRGEDRLDYLIVLGAQVYENGPSPVLRFRLDTAIEYLNNHAETQCIVTGCQGANEPMSEARGMADYLVNHGIDESRIILEEQAANTKENIFYSMKLYDWENFSAGIVTNNFHLFRSLKLAEKQGMKNVSGIAAPSSPIFLLNNCLREFLGLIKDFAVGNI